jgi:hypothetical protein
VACGAAPLSVAFKAFTKAKNKLTKYRLQHANLLVDHTISTDRGARPLDRNICARQYPGVTACI